MICTHTKEVPGIHPGNDIDVAYLLRRARGKETHAEGILVIVRDHPSLEGVGDRLPALVVLVIDLPGSFNMAEDMMDLCDEVYVPENGDPISEARGDELEEYLDLCKKLKLKAKLHRVRLPETEPFRSMSSHIDELVYGELGEMVREYARKLE